MRFFHRLSYLFLYYLELGFKVYYIHNKSQYISILSLFQINKILLNIMLKTVDILRREKILIKTTKIDNITYTIK